jgi:hypothetical protein
LYDAGGEYGRNIRDRKTMLGTLEAMGTRVFDPDSATRFYVIGEDAAATCKPARLP